jgi:acyl-CoA thioester hydrolase
MTILEIPIALRWADIDGYAHVNNAAMLTLLEEARIAAFWASDDPSAGDQAALLEAGPGAASLTLIARQEIEYLLPIEYTRIPLRIRLWISHLGGASLDVSYEVCVADVVHARALTSIVLVEAATGRPRRITPTEREAWAPHLAPQVQFRQRRREIVAR